MNPSVALWLGTVFAGALITRVVNRMIDNSRVVYRKTLNPQELDVKTSGIVGCYRRGLN